MKLCIFFLLGGINLTNPYFYSRYSAFLDISLGALDNRTFVIAWVDNVEDDISFIVYDTNGTNLTSTVDVDETVDGNSRVSVTARNSTHFAVS